MIKEVSDWKNNGGERKKTKCKNDIKICFCPFHIKLHKKQEKKRIEKKQNEKKQKEAKTNKEIVFNNKCKLIKFEDVKTKISNEQNNFFIKNGNYSFKEPKTVKNKEISFYLIPQIKNLIKLQKESVDDIQFYQPRKWNNTIIDKENYFNILNQNKNNDSFLTQETSENFSISSLNKSKDIISENPKGLNNFSLNCYMNSLLQCFYHIKGLRTSFIDPSKYSSDNQKVCHSLSEVMKELTYGNNNSYSPKNFKKTLGKINSLFSEYKGIDVSNLYRTVIDSIIDEILMNILKMKIMKIKNKIMKKQRKELIQIIQ